MYEYTLQLERVKTELQKFGVSPNQAKVYIYLGKYGPKTAPEVFKALDLPRTETYYILNTLQNHGIITSALTSPDRKSTRLNSSHMSISYAVFCLKKKINNT